MTTAEAALARIRQRTAALYGDAAGSRCHSRILQLFDLYHSQLTAVDQPLWTQRDVVLITYADQVQQADQPTLPVLERFLQTTGLNQLFNTVHLLPFFPHSSDDGFSVIDYRAVDPPVGSWQDVQNLSRQTQLMLDLVLNHVSQQSAWFRDYLAGREPFTEYFLEVDPATDVSQVTRPRSLPLLSPFETRRGTRHVWTTFSADQIDLNFANPDVLVEMIDVLLFYIAQGARIVRLDAVAYLWKQLGTSCVHLPQTHEVVKLLRDVVDTVAPHVLLLTETNVPHRENVSYFGQQDEAHMVYQFSLPPLLLDALLHYDATNLMGWLRGLETPAEGTTYFNFTASHDGIGVRPLEGLASPERLQRLVEITQARGGHVSTRRNPDGSDTPYELNVTYLDILGGDEWAEAEQVRRFLTSQAVMLALQGVPGIYFHSLVGSPNDEAAWRETGIPRRINRHKYPWGELLPLLENTESVPGRVYRGYRELLARRIAEPAFHPDGPQTVLETGNPRIISFERRSPDGARRVVVLANVGRQAETLLVSALAGARPQRDLLGSPLTAGSEAIQLEPFQIVWLEASE